MPTTLLPMGLCWLIELPKEDNKDCEYLPNGTYNEDNCVQCEFTIKFLFGGDYSDPFSSGQLACIILWLSVLITGGLGILTNWIIIMVVRKRKKRTSFDLQLGALAIVDLVTSVANMVHATHIIFFYQNLERGLSNLVVGMASATFSMLGKSLSASITAQISVERYLAISNPLKSRLWLTPRRTKCITGGLTAFAVFFNMSRAMRLTIRYNQKWQNIPSLANMDYVIIDSELERLDVWFVGMNLLHFIDLCAPFVVLLVFNVLLFVKLSNIAKTRQQLTQRQEADIDAVRMVVPVVIVLFLCNLFPIAGTIYNVANYIIHREVLFLMLLSYTVNSAVNLSIYYVRSASFREEVRGCLAVHHRWPCLKLRENGKEGNTSETGGGTEGSSGCGRGRVGV